MTTDGPIDGLLQRLRELLDSAGAQTGPLAERVERVVTRFLEPFALMPRQAFEAHMRQFDELERSVARLEAQLRALETDALRSPAPDD